MVEQAIKTQIAEDFAFTLQHPNIKGIILYGSYLYSTNSPRSDIDICVVAPEQNLSHIHKYIYSHLENHLNQYEIRFFEEFPLYLQGEIMENGMIILSPNPLELAEYFHSYRKQWNHEKWRINNVA